MVMLAGAAAPIAARVTKAAITRALNKKKSAAGKASRPRRRRTRLLTMAQRDELTWVARHLGRTAAAERMMHYRR